MLYKCFLSSFHIYKYLFFIYKYHIMQFWSIYMREIEYYGNAVILMNKAKYVTIYQLYNISTM